jgi:hypothetical protein
LFARTRGSVDGTDEVDRDTLQRCRHRRVATSLAR